MSRSPERPPRAAPFRPSAETLGKNRPTPMPELMKIINRGMEKERSFAYWMNRATKWREELVKAVEAGNKEWIFVCAARTAAIIFEKTLKHPDVNTELTSGQIRILQRNGQTLLGDVQGLKKELREVYAQWAAIERVRQQELDRDLSKLQSVLTAEEGEDKPLPSVPAPEPDLEVDSLHPIHIRAYEISRPGSPSLDGPANRGHFAKSNLMKAPSRPSSPPEGELPTYEEVMGDLLEIDGSVGGDGGSDYNIQVVEPDAGSSKAVTPQLFPEILPAVDEGDMDSKVDRPSRGRSSSRRSSVTKDKSRSRSADLRVCNPSLSREEEDLRDVGIALDGVYRQLALLRKGGLRKLPDDVRNKIEDLKQFLL